MFHKSIDQQDFRLPLWRARVGSDKQGWSLERPDPPASACRKVLTVPRREGMPELDAGHPIPYPTRPFGLVQGLESWGANSGKAAG